MRKLSELGGVCLGIASKLQPCTAYRVRCDLKEAPSSHWRASAGSVYPLLARLEAEKLLSSASDAGDGRGRKLIRVTAKGRKSLRNWISSGTAHDIVASTTDPVRSRTFFLEFLSPAEQINFVEKLIDQMETFVQETEDHLQHKSESEDLYDYLGAMGATTIAQARLDWLRMVRERLVKK